MPNNLEIIQRTIEEFQRIQDHMDNARSENAAKTLSLKALLNTAGVDLTEIDHIKE